MNDPFLFDSSAHLVMVAARIAGPSGRRYLRLALDTGATFTVIRTARLVALGYDTSVSVERVQMTTASGIHYAPRLPISTLEALGHTVTDFPVVAHTLPSSAPIDGLLGLDFMRRCDLFVDFRNGLIELTCTNQSPAPS